MDRKLHMEEILDLIFDHIDEYPELRGVSIFVLDSEKTWAALKITSGKAFQIESFNTVQISPDICEKLRSCCPVRHFFPILQAIEWLDSSPECLPVLAMFSSSRLNRVRLDAACFATVSSSLSTLCLNHPDLTKVQIRGRYRVYCGPGVIQSTSAFLTNLNRLESLTVSNVDAAILEHISGLPSLKALDITEFMSLGFVPQGNGVDPPFPCLEELSLWETTPDVGLTMQSNPTSQTTARLYAAIDANRSYAILNCLRLEDKWINREDPPDEDKFKLYLVDPGLTLQILFPFTNLTTVILKPCYGFALNDRVVSEMARAWSRVEELRLARSHDLHAFEFTEAVTLQGIRAIATHCKNLHTLEINFDATRIPPPCNTCPQTSLTIFYPHCARITTPTAVASFLLHIFPKLDDVRYSCLLEQPTSTVGRWRKVQRLIIGSTYRSSESSTDEEYMETDEDEAYSDSD
ncbi:hypothetical protein C8R47DRAFT_1326653 [Mycena vitilis]|nr:hypothetical protein C8R47DRAFT_1326653 [Mycena vitilis]